MFGRSQKKETEQQTTAVPVRPFDTSKRYDIYHGLQSATRIFRDVRLVGIRTCDAITEYSTGAIGGLFELEAADGTHFLIPQYSIELMCEHGSVPQYTDVPTKPVEPTGTSTAHD